MPPLADQLDRTFMQEGLVSPGLAHDQTSHIQARMSPGRVHKKASQIEGWMQPGRVRKQPPGSGVPADSAVDPDVPASASASMASTDPGETSFRPAS